MISNIFLYDTGLHYTAPKQFAMMLAAVELRAYAERDLFKTAEQNGLTRSVMKDVNDLDLFARKDLLGTGSSITCLPG